MFASLFTSDTHSSSVRLGFRFGDKGTQSSRTIMFEELQSLLDAVPGNRERLDYEKAALEDNCLGKKTLSTRKLSLQRLSELYALDPGVPLFRIMRDLWDVNPKSRPQLALLLALARDPLLRMTAASVLHTPIGKEFARQDMTDALEEGTGTRFKNSILDKIVRNASSSWTQSGHLQGRARKFRQQIRATPAALAYAFLLGYLQGVRGQNLFSCPWAKVLDLDELEARERADDAKRLGLLDIKQSGSLIDISFPQLLTGADKELLYGAD
ncbi:MAG: hypothetical protein L3J03_00750 [Desulfobacterales bacterium]|nr:hypothetical protein [Desulfobacterales bacterium]